MAEVTLDKLRAEIRMLRSTIDEIDVVESFVRMVGEEQEDGNILVPGDALQIVSSTLSIFTKARDLLAAIEMYSVDKKMAYMIYNRAIFPEHGREDLNTPPC
jgi:prefoldin subunit 5